MAPVSTRRSIKNGVSGAASKVFRNDPGASATEEDRRNWGGFCEVESEPVRDLTHNTHKCRYLFVSNTGILQCNAQRIRCQRGQSARSCLARQ